MIRQKSSSRLFLPEAIMMSSSGMGRDIHSLTWFIRHFLRRPRCRPSSKDGLEETLVACDTPEPCKFPSFDSCQEELPVCPTRKLTLFRSPVVGLVLQVGNAETFPQHLFLTAWITFSVSSSRIYVPQPYKRLQMTKETCTS